MDILLINKSHFSSEKIRILFYVPILIESLFFQGEELGYDIVDVNGEQQTGEFPTSVFCEVYRR